MNQNNSIVIGNIHNKMCGFYKVMVLDSKTKEVIADYGWDKNIIINNGMDMLPTYSYASVTTYAVAGTGSRPNKIVGGTSTITQSGNIITLWPEAGGLQTFSSSISSSSPYEIYYSSSLQTGDVIVYSNNSHSNVISIDTVGGLTASVNTSYTIGSGSNQTFTIWKTSQTGLQKEVKRSNTYLTGIGNCGSTDSTGSTGVANIRTYRRTYDFTGESFDKLYTEIGVSPISTPNNLVFSRVLLSNPVEVSASFQLRVIYDLAVEFTPTSQHIITASISGWPVDVNSNTHASESIQKFLASTVDTSGGATIYTALLEPGPAGSPLAFSTFAVNRAIFLSSVSTSLAPFNSAVNRGSGVYAESTGPHSSPPYVTGSYQLFKENYLGLNDANTTTSSGIWTVGFGMQSNFPHHPYITTDQAICILFHESQSKLNTQVVSMSFGYTWDRVLAGT